jgi:hypothetical protein
MADSWVTFRIRIQAVKNKIDRRERTEAFRGEVIISKKALDYWAFRKGPNKAEIDSALQLFSGSNRNKSVLMLLDESPKTLAEILSAVPGETGWVTGIADAVVSSGWALGPNMGEPRYRISPAGKRIMRILDAIPDFIKNAAWDANWRGLEK